MNEKYERKKQTHNIPDSYTTPNLKQPQIHSQPTESPCAFLPLFNDGRTRQG